jgi:hypothetical protein
MRISNRQFYPGGSRAEEVLVMAKIHRSPRMSIEELAVAIDGGGEK